MPSLTVEMILSYGPTTPTGTVPCRKTTSLTFAYNEQSIKTVHVPPGQPAFAVALDTITAPKLLLIRAVDVDVGVGLSDGVTTTNTALSAAGGWTLLSNPSGQPINALTIATPASPVAGAYVEILAFE